jgi:hypothetical protein
MRKTEPLVNTLLRERDLDEKPEEETLDQMLRRQHDTEVRITKPRMARAEFLLIGTAPYMQNRFGKKAQDKMEEAQKAGSQAKSKRQRAPRNFEKDYQEATHFARAGWCGIPAGSFRAAAISACRLVGFKMTLAKLTIFILHDDLDKVDNTPLVRIEGTRAMSKMPVRNATGVMDIRARPIWREWRAHLRVEWDLDQFSLNDITNLFMRVGRQVGVGAGRPDSKDSTGLGFGLFSIQPWKDGKGGTKQRRKRKAA